MSRPAKLWGVPETAAVTEADARLLDAYTSSTGERMPADWIRLGRDLAARIRIQVRANPPAKTFRILDALARKEAFVAGFLAASTWTGRDELKEILEAAGDAWEAHRQWGDNQERRLEEGAR